MLPRNDGGDGPGIPESGNLFREKQSWRLAISGIFSLVPPETRAGLDRALTGRIADWLGKGGSQALLAFVPLADEPDIFLFLRRWLAGGGVLGLPVWPDGGNLVFRRVENLDRQLRPGRGGIREPVPELPEIRLESAGAALVPGRAFSETLERLGRGAGCYDRLFRNGGPARAGVAYDFQIFPRLPAGEGDVRMGAVLTPSRTIGRG
jgi:5-formyltetrahydrofolate cyclo-ligase